MRAFVSFILLVMMIAGSVANVSAVAPANDAMRRTWERTDSPVASGVATRTWMWGPEAFTGQMQEDYLEAPGGKRAVQYFDKSRMEITDPAADATSVWYVTNGLLVQELVTGNMQVGHDVFVTYSPADVNVAGDSDDPTGPTYKTIAQNIEWSTEYPLVFAQSEGDLITKVTDRIGVDLDRSDEMESLLAAYGVTAGPYSPETGKHTASVFWHFMNSQAVVFENGGYVTGKLFQNPFYATGLPIDQAWWANVKVAGTYQWVLIQCFERRCLTYNPQNAPEWRVEAGNVGQHYYTWRYSNSQPVIPAPKPEPTPEFYTFGDGMFLVGVDVQPGTYRNSDSSRGCYWERLSGFGGSLDEIIANEFTYSRDIVTIAASDLGFSSSRCGIWTSDLSPVTSSLTSDFGDGTYLVGIDIAPGVWRNSDSSAGCYWERLKGFSGSVLKDVIDNEFTYSEQIVTISPSDKGFSASRCGVWTRVSP